MSKISYRLEDNRTYLALPYFGEFGWFILSHVPQINKWCQTYPTTVACERGQEFLFPFAKNFFYDYKRLKINIYSGKPEYQGEQKAYITLAKEIYDPKIFIDTIKTKKIRNIHNDIHINKKCLKQYNIDISIGARKISWNSNKNYQHWQTIVDFCKSYDLTVGVCGIKGSTMKLKNIDLYSFNSSNTTMGCASMMNSARMVINLDSGLLHLASMLDIKQYAVRSWPEKNKRQNRTFEQGVNMSLNANIIGHEAYDDPSVIIHNIKQELNL